MKDIVYRWLPGAPAVDVDPGVTMSQFELGQIDVYKTTKTSRLGTFSIGMWVMYYLITKPDIGMWVMYYLITKPDIGMWVMYYLITKPDMQTMRFLADCVPEAMISELLLLLYCAFTSFDSQHFNASITIFS